MLWLSCWSFNILFSFCKLVSSIACSEPWFNLLALEVNSAPWHDDLSAIFVTLFICVGAILITPTWVLTGMIIRLLLAFIMSHFTASWFLFLMLPNNNTSVMECMWKEFSLVMNRGRSLHCDVPVGSYLHDFDFCENSCSYIVCSIWCCLKSVRIWSLFWSVFFLLQTEYGEILCPNVGTYEPERLQIQTLFTQWELH